MTGDDKELLYRITFRGGSEAAAEAMTAAAGVEAATKKINESAATSAANVRLTVGELRAQLGADFDKTIAQAKVGSAALNQSLQTAATSTRQALQTEAAGATDVLIAESQKAIASAERAAAGAAQAVQSTTASLAAAEKEAASFTGQLGSVASALGPAALGVGVLVAAEAALVTALVKTTFEVAAASDQIYEMSVKTGLSVETLSALDSGARLAGTTLDKLSAGLVILDKNTAAAATGTGKNAAAFKALNVDLTNNEAVLTAVFNRLASLPRGAEQSAEAVKFFGRSGAEMLKVVNEAGASLDDFKRKLTETGLLLTGPEAEAAHKFEESWRRVGLQVSAIERQFGNQTIPALDQLGRVSTTTMGGAEKDLSLATVAGAAFAQQIREITNSVIILETAFAPTLKLLQTFSDYTHTPTGGEVPAPKMPALGPVTATPVTDAQQAEELVQVAKREAAEAQRQAEATTAAQKRMVAEGATTAAAAAQVEIEATRKATEAKVGLLMAEKQLLEQREKEETDSEKSAKLKGEIEDKEQQIANERSKAEQERLNKLSALRVDAAQKAKHAADIEKSAYESIARATAAATLANENFGKSDIDAAVAVMRANSGVEKLTGSLRAQAEVLLNTREAEMRDLDAKQKLKEATEENKEKADEAAQAAFDLGKELSGRTLTATQQVSIFLAKYTGFVDDNTAALLKNLAALKDVDDAMQKSAESAEKVTVTLPELPMPKTGPGYGREGKLPYVDPAQFTKEFGKAPPPNFAPIKNAIKDLKTEALGSFKAMAAGLGQMAASWAASGRAAGMSIGQLVKSALQGLTAMALTQGFIELAEAAAGLTPWGVAHFGPPGPHLKAAGYFFLAAGVAGGLSAIGGGGGAPSAVAGNAFSSGTSDTSGGTSTNSPAPIREGRTGGAPNPDLAPVTRYVIIEKQTVLKPPDGWIAQEIDHPTAGQAVRNVINKVVAQDWRPGGQLREKAMRSLGYA